MTLYTAAMNSKSYFRIATLISGSSGNSVYAENPEGALLIDAGRSKRAIEEGIAALGGDIDVVREIVITHDHTDHSGAAGPLARKYGMQLVMTEGTFEGCGHRLGKIGARRTFAPGGTFPAGGFQVHAVATPHDGEDPAVIMLEHGGLRCGVFTDLGCVTDAIRRAVAKLDGVILESNHDPDMLKNGSYPEDLKERIRSCHGHISNIEAAELVRDHAGPNLRFVVLAHLSEENNTPKIAEETMRDVAGERLEEIGAEVYVAPRFGPSPVMSVGTADTE